MTAPASRARAEPGPLWRLRPGRAAWTALVLVIGLGGVLLVRSPAALVVWLLAAVAAGQLPLVLPAPDPEVACAAERRRADAATARAERRAEGVAARAAERERRARPEVAAERRRRAWACAAAGLAWPVLLFPVLWRAAHGPITGFLFSDWTPHLRLVPRFQLDPIRVPIPHFMFELSTRIVLELTGLSLRTAGTVVATVFVGFTGAALAWFFQRPWGEGGRRPGPWFAAGCSVAFVLSELPQFTFFGTQALRDDLMNVSIHQWNTPSTVTAESFQILVFVGAVTAITERWPVDRTARWLPLIAAVAMIAKPSVPLVLAGAVVLWLVRSGSPAWAWRRGVLGVTIPVGIMLLVQLAIGAFWWEPDETAGLDIVFGGALRHLDFWSPGLAVAILPVLALVTGGRELTRNPATRLAAWAVVVGCVAAGSIVETGLRAADGNVARTAFGGFWLLYLCLLRWAVELWQRRGEWPTWTRTRQVGAALLAVYLVLCMVSGIGLYLEEVGLITFTGATGQI